MVYIRKFTFKRPLLSVDAPMNMNVNRYNNKLFTSNIQLETGTT